MKILLIDDFIHHKNRHALLSYNIITDIKRPYENINFNEFDIVISPSTPINVRLYPNVKFIFGPHFSVFPDARFQQIVGNNSVYNVLSKWISSLFLNFDYTNNLNLITIPFGVDTERFSPILPIQERKDVLVYYKKRKEKEQLAAFLQSKQITYYLIEYGTYKEEDYLKQLQKTRYCIWLGCHESQGFALQEALSCDVPLLVWNVSSMKQEYDTNNNDYPATSIPYWNESCGEFFYNFEELETVYNRFIRNLENYTPRQFVLTELSMNVCKNRLLNLFKTR